MDGRPHLFHNLPLLPRLYTGTKLYCLVTEAHGCAQLAQSCYLIARRPGIELKTSRSLVRCPNNYATKPRNTTFTINSHAWPSCCKQRRMLNIRHHNSQLSQTVADTEGSERYTPPLEYSNFWPVKNTTRHKLTGYYNAVKIKVKQPQQIGFFVGKYCTTFGKLLQPEAIFKNQNALKGIWQEPG